MSFTPYQPRKIEFRQIVNLNDWHVKVYTFTFREKFQAESALQNVIAKLPEWLKITKSLNFETYKIAF